MRNLVEVVDAGKVCLVFMNSLNLELCTKYGIRLTEMLNDVDLSFLYSF